MSDYWKFRQDLWRLDLGHTAKCVLNAIADFADDEGRDCFPSRERIAWKTNLSVRQVQRVMTRLTELGVLVPEGNRLRGRSRPVVYRIELPDKLLRSDWQKVGHSYVPLSEEKEGHSYVPLSEPEETESRTFEAESRTFEAEKKDIAMSYNPSLINPPEETPKEDGFLLDVVRAVLYPRDRTDIASVSRADGTVTIAYTRPELGKLLAGPGYQSSIGRALRAAVGPVRWSLVALSPSVTAVSADAMPGA